MRKYNVDKVYIDGANPSFMRSLKLHIGEDPDYDKVIARYRSEELVIIGVRTCGLFLLISILNIKLC